MLPQRSGLRLRGYDYSSGGAYFLTACTTEKRCILSEIRRGDPCGRPPVQLTALGRAVEEAIAYAAELYEVTVHAAIIMPNHVHLLISLPGEERRATARVAPTVGRFMGAVKSRAVNEWHKTPAAHGSVWQRGYYDHIIRDERDCLRVLKYMEENPAKWSEDCYYTENKGVTAPCPQIPPP